MVKGMDNPKVKKNEFSNSIPRSSWFFNVGTVQQKGRFNKFDHYLKSHRDQTETNLDLGLRVLVVVDVDERGEESNDDLKR